MPNQSSVTLQKAKTAIGSSKSFVDEANNLKKMDSTRILAAETTHASQYHKMRCFEKLVLPQDIKCALEAEVVDDTALIDATCAITGFKNRYRTESDAGYGNRSGNDAKKKRDKGVKKQEAKCSMKCLNEKKLKSHVVKDKNTNISEGKGCKKMSPSLKFGNQRKDTKNLKVVATGVQETDIKLKVSVGIEKELTTQLAETETETVNVKDDGLMLNPVIVVHTKNNVAEGETVYENTTVGVKKTAAYSREEIEALRSVDEEGQKSKWNEVYSGFAPSVAREYTGLVADANNRLSQRYNRVVNCGSARKANASLSMPPVLPLCSPSYYM